MPRKTRRTLMPPLSFLEPSLGGARLQRMPDVRAALHPKSLITEKGHNSSTSLTSWVSPQFNQSHVVAPPARRRGRRGCQSSLSILDRSAQLPVKRSVTRFPSLSFRGTAVEDRPRPRPRRTESSPSPQQLCSVGGTEREAHPAVTTTPLTTPPDPPVAPDDVDTPRCPSPALSPPPQTPLSQPGALAPSCGTPEEVQVLVADTPERDYGLKVTWRRRRGLMAFLKERGLLSESDMLIDS